MTQNSRLELSIPSSLSAIIVGVQKPEASIEEVHEDLSELSSLLTTLGVKTRGRVIQKRQKLSPSHLLGAGKIDEIRALAQEECATVVVIDHPLTGAQIKNLETLTGCEIFDRSFVILAIFSKHAKTGQAKTQVEIARLEYMLPRLTRAWTHLNRQVGGGVYARGMGETQIEIDRRRARDRINRLQKRLDQIRKEKITQRKSRSNELKVSLVGYTNSGKTTIMNALTHCQNVGKNELFATLDTTVRTIDPSTRPTILLSDTVGFIRNLPHGLIESFKSTLDEVVSANLLLHVVDVSHPSYAQHMETTLAVLNEIGAGDIPSILVFNKIDQVDEQFLERILRKKYSGCIVMSAQNLDDAAKLREHILDFFKDQFSQTKLIIPIFDQNSLSLVYKNCIILGVDYESEGEVHFVVRGSDATLSKLERYQKDFSSMENLSAHSYS